MKTESFVYWLQGFNELCGTPPTDEQWKVIQEHLALTLTNVTQPKPLNPPLSLFDQKHTDPKMLFTC